MCGICGVYNYGTGEPAGEQLLRAMTAAMIHRGPDDDGFRLDGPLALGMRRLSIIDLGGGAQPMSNEEQTVWVVSNGEIYNFRELRRELEGHGHRFRSKSDTEVIVHAYEEWGVDALARLNGMFGTAIWDAGRRRLVLARDPFGIKPLYYWDDGRRIAFASEIRSLLCHPAIDRSVDLEALDQFLAYTFVPSPRTAFAGIGKLLPGHALVCTAEGTTLRRFHEPGIAPRTYRDERELVAELRDAVRAAVERQMVADVPVGAMLSGGIDSAAVTAIMAECTSGTVDTFTVGFGSEFPKDELVKARAVARRIGTNHHEVVLSAREYADFLPRSIRSLEEPIATASTHAFYAVCELASRSVKVVLTGQGADEPFGGYARHLGERYGHLYRGIPPLLRDRLLAPAIRRLPRNEQLKRAVAALGVSDPVERMHRVYSVIDRDLLEQLAPGSRRQTFQDSVGRWAADVGSLDDLGRMLYVDARFSLPDNLLLYGDKMSMAVSLEARVPFLDLELMKVAEAIPSRLKIRGLTRKHIFRQAIAPWVPAGDDDAQEGRVHDPGRRVVPRRPARPGRGAAARAPGRPVAPTSTPARYARCSISTRRAGTTSSDRSSACSRSSCGTRSSSLAPAPAACARGLAMSELDLRLRRLRFCVAFGRRKPPQE